MPTRERRARALGVPVDQLPDGRGMNPKPKGSMHYRWNAGRITSSHGYTKVRVGLGHPLADPNGYAYEHLLVWVAAGHPKPDRDQVLHHENEDRADNRIENLRLMNRGLHTIEEHLDRDDAGKFASKAAGRHLDGREHTAFPVTPQQADG